MCDVSILAGPTEATVCAHTCTCVCAHVFPTGVCLAAVRGVLPKSFLLVDHPFPGLFRRSFFLCLLAVRVGDSRGTSSGVRGRQSGPPGHRRRFVPKSRDPEAVGLLLSPFGIFLCLAVVSGHVFSVKKESPGGMCIFFVRSRRCTSFYDSNCNMLFFKMFSYLIFTLQKPTLKALDCFSSIFIFLEM